MAWKKPELEVIECGMEVGAYRSPFSPTEGPLDGPADGPPSPRPPRSEAAAPPAPRRCVR